jgi:hypothetical protein
MGSAKPLSFSPRRRKKSPVEGLLPISTYRGCRCSMLILRFGNRRSCRGRDSKNF